MYRLSTQEHPQIFARVPKRFCGKGDLNEKLQVVDVRASSNFPPRVPKRFCRKGDLNEKLQVVDVRASSNFPPRVPKRFCGKGDLNEKLQVVDVRASSNFPEGPQEVLRDRGFGLFRRRDSRFQ